MAYPVGVHVSEGQVGVDFQLLLKGYNQSFRISREALEDHFDAGGEDLAIALETAFKAHWDVIAAVAARKGGTPRNGVIVLNSDDF